MSSSLNAKSPLSLEKQLSCLQAENSRLANQLAAFQQDQLEALAIQNSLLPANHLVLADWQLHYHQEAALQLTGDFLDFFSSPPSADIRTDSTQTQRLYFYLADVAGSGAASASLALLVKYLIRKLSTHYPSASPAQLCAYLNQELVSLEVAKHLTLALGCLNPVTYQLSFCLAGHLPLALVVTGEPFSLQPIDNQNPPLGLFPTAEYQDYTCQLASGSRICLASDGVLEVMQGEGLAAKHSAWQQLVGQHQGRLEGLVAALVQPAEGWPDDLSLMTLTQAY